MARPRPCDSRVGSRVLCVARGGGARETAELIAEEGGEAAALQADVTVAEQVRDMVEHCVAAYGRIDILHNNVGLDRVGGPVETSEQSWDDVIRTNLTSQFLTCKYTLPVMERQRGGAIINMSSIAGLPLGWCAVDLLCVEQGGGYPVHPDRCTPICPKRHPRQHYCAGRGANAGTGGMGQLRLRRPAPGVATPG